GNWCKGRCNLRYLSSRVSKRRTQVTLEKLFHKADILYNLWLIKAILFQIKLSGFLRQILYHGADRVARDAVDQKKGDRRYNPQNQNHVEHALNNKPCHSFSSISFLFL